jgi:hypothetical protein
MDYPQHQPGTGGPGQIQLLNHRQKTQGQGSRQALLEIDTGTHRALLNPGLRRRIITT